MSTFIFSTMLVYELYYFGVDRVLEANVGLCSYHSNKFI